MGFLSAFSNIGSIGSTARWAIKGYSSIKSKNKKIPDNQIFSEIIRIRYKNLSNKEKVSYLLKEVKNMPGIAGLVIEILNVETKLYENDGYYIDERIKPIFVELEKTDFSKKIKYGKLNIDLKMLNFPEGTIIGMEWTNYIYNFPKRSDYKFV